MHNEAGAGVQNNREARKPVNKHAWERIVEGRAAGWQGRAGRGEVDALPKREKTPKAKEPEPTTTTEPPQGSPYRERPLTVAEQLEEKLKQLKAKVHNNEIHADLMAAEQLFEDLKRDHSEEEVAAYDQKLKITEGLEVARHLANIYNQLEVWKADPEQQAHPSDDAQDPASLHQKAELSLQESRKFSKKYEAALKELDEMYHGRSDEEAQETQGLEGDDLTLPYEKRLGFLETKVRERLKTATGREATQEEFDRVVYNVNSTPSPLSKPKRVGQFLKRLGESTLGKVFDTFADTSIQEAVSQYRALENQGIKASETVQELMAEKARREAYAQQLQEQIKNLEKIRTAREEREARQKAIEKMKPEPLANGEILAKEEVLEKKRRILARNKFEIEERDQKEKHKAEIVAAERVGDKAKVKGLKARKDYTANDLERDEAATEAFDTARLEAVINKRIQEWRNTQRVLKSFGEDFIDPNSKAGKAQEEEIRDQVIAETRKNRADILANKGREGEEDLFFGKEDALEERNPKANKQPIDLEEPEKAPSKPKKQTNKKRAEAQIISERNSGNYTLEDAEIPYPEKPITLGNLPDKKESDEAYSLDRGIRPKEEMSFVMGEEPTITEVPFKLKPAELALHSSSEPLTEKALQQEAKGVLEKITREAKKLPPQASEFSMAKSIRDELQKYPIDWRAQNLKSVMDQLHRQQQTYQAQIEHGTINETIKNELRRWVSINQYLIDLSQKTDAEQEAYLAKIYKSSLKPELAIRQKGGLQKGEVRQKQDESEKQKRQERKRRSEIMSQLLQELKDASSWGENDVKVLAEGILESMQRQGFSTEEIKGSLEEFSKNETSSWKEQREKQTGRVQKGAKNKLLMMAELDSLLQPKGPEDSKSSRGGAEQPPVSTKATDTERSSQRKAEEPTGYPSQEILDEDIADEEIEAFLEDSLLKEGLNIITLKTKIKESIQKAQETSPKEWQNTETLLRASILFKKEGSTQLTPEKIAKKYLDFLCLYRLAKMQEQKADVTLIQKQVINSLSPRIGVPTQLIDKWAKQSVPMELVPNSIAQKLDTYKKKPAQEATS